MMADKMRVHILAKELNVLSKVIVEKCKAEGIASVKNHMSTLSAGLHATIREWFTEGSHDMTVETAHRVDLKKVRIKRTARRTETGLAEREIKSEAIQAQETTTGDVCTATVEPRTTAATVAAEAPSIADEDQHVHLLETAVTAAPTAEKAPKAETEVPDAEATAVESATGEAEAVSTVSEVEAPAAEALGPEPTTTPIRPAGPQNVPAKAKLQGPRVVRYEALDYDARLVRRRLTEGRGADTAAPPPHVSETPAPSGPAAPGVKEPARRKGRENPRRVAGRLAESSERLAEWRDLDLQERRERLAGATGRRIFRRRAAQQSSGIQVHPVVTGPKTEATVHEPVRMKDFSSATGLNFLQCLKVLREEHNIVANVNMILAPETAELLALHFGIELTVIPSKTLLDELQEEFANRERKHQQLRPPVVAMLGHVDHGKTSLLDAIRNTRVAAGEDGGITQHIGACQVETPHGAVTFLDTPGHEAFTAMRARGAQLTDVVVLVVAADDGLMPQTVEAINHAQAAEVPIVVALNKIDLGEQNKLKIYGQLAERGLAPGGEWGGDVDVIPTSATTGAGVAELVEHLAALSSLLDLKADPTLPATGTVVEAETKPGVGAVVRLLVQDGKLHVGDFVVCGPAYGKVRALLDDRNERIQEAGPSLPVEVWGLDNVPAAGDKLYVVDRLQRAKDIAAKSKEARIVSARVRSRKVKSLEEMFLQRDLEEIPELHVIIKADTDGSVSALRQALGDFPSGEVKLTIQHAGVGMVTDSDILLAATCEGIVIAFRVETSGGVRRLSEHHGVDVRLYRVIYNVHDDIKKALEGLLAPEERIEPQGTAEVRQLFRLGKKLGAVAGSFVTDGVLNRKNFAKVIRDGVVVRERCKFASLRRFKDDVKEVRAGLECGIRLEGFDDVHVGDLIESYEIVEVARTL